MATRPTMPVIAATEVEAFAAMIRPRAPRSGEVTESDKFVAMLQRMVRAAEHRAIEDITILPALTVVAQQLADAVNVSVAVNAARFAVDPHRGASQAECAAALGISVPSAGDRKIRGAVVLLERLTKAYEAAGVIRGKFGMAKGRDLATRRTEAARERETRRDAVAKVEPQMAGYRDRVGKHRAA